MPNVGVQESCVALSRSVPCNEWLGLGWPDNLYLAVLRNAVTKVKVD